MIRIAIILLFSGCNGYPNKTITDPKVIIEGDSYSTSNKWPLFLKDSSDYFKNIDQVNYAKSGEQAYQIQSQYINEGHTTKGQWFFIYAGINDLAGANRSADTVYAALKYIWSSAKKDGYKIVAFTVIHSLYLTENKEAERLKLNKLILGNPELYDYVIDVANHFDPRTQPQLFVDKTHLTTEGFKKFAGVVARTLKTYTL